MQRSLKPAGVLYVVATPIGNLKDITLRALEVLGEADFILAEDTRHSQKLLTHYQIKTPLHAFHEHNEKAKSAWIREELRAGKKLALISDAGTPLISDPGFYLVRLLREEGVLVIPIPGPCAFVTALSIAGLPTDQFVFDGFLPAKRHERCTKLKAFLRETRTLVFYESCHRILQTLLDMSELFGNDRMCVVARELTKSYESVLSGNLLFVRESILAHSDTQKGEFVILLKGRAEKTTELSAEAQEICEILLESLPLKQAVTLTAKITKLPKNLLYNFAVKRVYTQND